MIKIRSFFRITAEVTSLMLIAGFVFSVLINQYLFLDWGLEFLQVATVNDVVMSGLMFSAFLFKSILPFALGLYIGVEFVKSKWLNRNEQTRAGMFIVAIAIFISAFINSISSPLGELMIVMLTCYMAGAFIKFYLKLMALRRLKLFGYHISSQRSVLAVKTVSSAIALPVILFLTMLFVPRTWAEGQFGYITAGVQQSGRPKGAPLFGLNIEIDRCKRLVALWSGEKAVVMACDNSFAVSPADVIVVLNPEDLLLGSATLHPSGPARRWQRYDCSWPDDRRNFKNCMPTKATPPSPAPIAK
jgi:hypothetical protein